MGSDSSQSVLDAAGNTIVLAFDLAGSQIANMPDELEDALQKPDVQLAIQRVLASFALSRQQKGTTAVSDAEAKQLAKDLWSKAGGKLSDSALEQLKSTPEYKNLEKSISDLERALKSSPVGVWVDNNKNILYVVGAGLVIGGAVALYVTKTGGTVINTPLRQLSGKPVKIFKLGRFSLSGQMLSFKPDLREVGGGLVGTEKWDKVELTVEIGVVATGSNVKEIDGKIVIKTKDIDLGITGTETPSKNTVNLGISLGIPGLGRPGLTIGVSGVVKDGKVAGGGVTGDWQLDKTTALEIQASSAGRENKGMLLFTKRF